MLYQFDAFRLDVHRRELRHGHLPVPVEPQVFDLLVHLVRERHRVVTRDELVATVWAGRVVSDSTVASRIHAARQALGDDGARQRYLRTASRRGIRFVADVREEGVLPGAAPEGAWTDTPGPPSGLREEVRFCRAPDGVQLAVASVGEGACLLKAASWMTHIAHDWQTSASGPMLERLARRHRLVRYDQRGNGLSDWTVGEFSFDSLVRDLEAVADVAGSQPINLLGISQGAALAVAFAARHPARVSRLVLAGGCARGWRHRGGADEIARREALAVLMREGWGQDNAAFRQVFTSLVFPDSPPSTMARFNEFQRLCTSPANAASLFLSFGAMDVSALLRQITVPTLVLHCRGDALVPFEQGLELARSIPGARFVPLESRNHIPLPHEAAWHTFTGEIESFLHHCPPQPVTPRTPVQGIRARIRP